MDVIASQITSLAIVYSTVYTSADRRKYQSFASLVFVWGIHRGRGKCFHLMTSSCFLAHYNTLPLHYDEVNSICTDSCSLVISNILYDCNYVWNIIVIRKKTSTTGKCSVDHLYRTFSMLWREFLFQFHSCMSSPKLLHVSFHKKLLNGVTHLPTKTPGGPLLTWCNFKPSLISNYMLSEVCDEIYDSFPNFNVCTVEIWEWITNFSTL